MNVSALWIPFPDCKVSLAHPLVNWHIIFKRDEDTNTTTCICHRQKRTLDGWSLYANLKYVYKILFLTDLHIVVGITLQCRGLVMCHINPTKNNFHTHDATVSCTRPLRKLSFDNTRCPHLEPRDHSLFNCPTHYSGCDNKPVIISNKTFWQV